MQLSYCVQLTVQSKEHSHSLFELNIKSKTIIIKYNTLVITELTRYNIKTI